MTGTELIRTVRVERTALLADYARLAEHWPTAAATAVDVPTFDEFDWGHAVIGSRAFVRTIPIS